MTRNAMLRWLFCVVLLRACGGGPLGAQETKQDPEPSQVRSLSAGTKSPPASIEQIEWIAGNWQGDAMGGTFEETWNAPSSGTMVGMFKFAQEHDVKFYELQTIAPQGDSLILRVKHFGPDLVGWEEKERSVEFPLVKIEKDEAFFDGLTYRRISADEMHIYVRIGGENGKVEEVKFVCRRVPPTARRMPADE